MKKLGAVLFIAGAFIAGGAALAGPGGKCNVCHYGSHDIDGYGNVIVTAESGWQSSHKPHGDCTMDYSFWSDKYKADIRGYYVDEDGNIVSDPTDSCICALMGDTSPNPNDPEPVP